MILSSIIRIVAASGGGLPRLPAGYAYLTFNGAYVTVNGALAIMKVS